jgi:non-specific serine/threonine protein kinase
VAVAVILLAGGGGDDKKESKSSAAATAAPAGLEWRAGHDAPVARQFAASTVDGGTIWVFGGIGATTSSPKTLAYDPAIDTWRSGPDLPLPLHHEMAVTYNGDPVVIGGWVPSGPNLTAQVSDRVFALQKGAWKELPKLNHPRAAAAAGVVGGKIVVVGGQADGKLVGPTEVFDGISWKDAADIPTKRDHLAAASDGKYVYAVGGRGLSADKNFTALERYDPGSDSWKKLPDMPTAAGGLGAAIVAGRLVAVGGESPTSVIDAVQSFDLKASKWSKLPSMRSPRHGTAVAAVGDSLYAIDGAAATGHVHSTRTVEALDFGSAPAGSPTVSGLKWRSGRDAPSARQFAASTVDDHAIWLFGGLAATTSTTKVEAYDPAIDTWKVGPDLPSPVHHAMGVTYNGDPVVIGGWVASGANLTAQTSNRVFALRNGAWVELPKLTHARAAAAAAVVGDKIVVAGGQADGKLVGPTEVFDGKSWKDAADIPTPRDHLAAASDGKYLYAVGGRGLSADKNLAALERYDPGDDSWKKLPNMPTAAGGLGAAIVSGQLVAVGGESPTSVIDTVQSFDLRTNKWSKLPAMKTPRHGTTVAAIGDSLYVIAGAAATGHVHSTPTVEALDFK